MSAIVRPIVRRVARGAQEGYIDPQLRMHIGYWESVLGKHPYFAGDEFTAADIQMSFPLEVAAARVGIETPGNVSAFIARVRERPAYQRALSAGGPFSVSA